MTLTERESQLIGLLRSEVKPALGCTEPIAVALAAAKAVELLGGGSEASAGRTNLDGTREDSMGAPAPCSASTAPASCGTPDGLDAGSSASVGPSGKRGAAPCSMNMLVEVSGNILKNGMGVGIPGTGMIGLHIAAALGAVCGRSAYGLEVLKDLDERAVEAAKGMVERKQVGISLADTEHLLYVKVTASSQGRSAWAVIEDEHDRFVETCVDGQVEDLRPVSSPSGSPDGTSLGEGLSVKEIYSFAKSVDFEAIRFILGDRDLNLALAKEGLEGSYGLQVGKAIRENQNEIFGEEFMSFAMGLTAAASDARMAGCKLPAMSNSGSGNQGITVSLPIIAYCIKYGVPDEDLARALVLSNLVAIHIKSLLGRLSALCGCVVASSGSACGLVYLRGGSYEQVCSAIKNMVGNITGMVCDGAKVGCAMKVASGVSSAVQSSVLALRGTCVGETDGIIDKDIEQTIRNLGAVGSSGMHPTDLLIQQIMLRK